jgi:hypothetical protein
MYYLFYAKKVNAPKPQQPKTTVTKNEEQRKISK